MTTENLLPCPFCETQPIWINETLSDGHYYIKCPHCQFTMKQDRRDKVIGFWNTRPQSSHKHVVSGKRLPVEFVQAITGWKKEEVQEEYQLWHEDAGASGAVDKTVRVCECADFDETYKRNGTYYCTKCNRPLCA